MNMQMSIIINEEESSSNISLPAKQLMLWEIWPGKQRFYLGGRLMSGPKVDRCYYIGAYIGLFALPLSEILITTGYLWEHLNPMLPLVTIYLWMASMATAIVTTFSDPGVIPRRFIFSLFGEVPEEYSSDAVITSKKARFCKTCEIYRPGHVHHCSLCDSCIEHFDHHCRYLNNCIGGRNYRWFVALVVHLAFLGLNLIDNLILFLCFDEGPSSHSERSLFAISEDSIVITIVAVLGVVTLAATILVTLLCLFHISLCCFGKKTIDVLRGKETTEGNKCCRKKKRYFKARDLIPAEDPGSIKKGQTAFVDRSESEVSV